LRCPVFAASQLPSSPKNGYAATRRRGKQVSVKQGVPAREGRETNLSFPHALGGNPDLFLAGSPPNSCGDDKKGGGSEILPFLGEHDHEWPYLGDLCVFCESKKTRGQRSEVRGRRAEVGMSNSRNLQPVTRNL